MDTINIEDMDQFEMVTATTTTTILPTTETPFNTTMFTRNASTPAVFKTTKFNVTALHSLSKLVLEQFDFARLWHLCMESTRVATNDFDTLPMVCLVMAVVILVGTIAAIFAQCFLWSRQKRKHFK